MLSMNACRSTSARTPKDSSTARAAPGQLGVQHPQHQMVKVDRVVVERPGLVGGTVDHPLDLRGMVEQWRQFRAGVDRAGVGVGGSPGLHGHPRPYPASGRSGLGRWEVGGRGGQLQHPLAGDAQQPGNFGGRDELRVCR
jgi:hypothetical protein